MKNRRIVIAAFLCIAILVVGVGYAAVSGHLSMNGSASFNKNAADNGFIENIVFSDAAVKEGTGGSAKTNTIVDTATADAQTATFTVSTLATKNESVTFTYKLTNNNLVAAKLDIKAQHTDGTPNPGSTLTFYEVDSIVVDGKNLLENPEDCILGAGATAEVEVTVSLKDTPETDVAMERYDLHITATSVDA